MRWAVTLAIAVPIVPALAKDVAVEPSRGLPPALARLERGLHPQAGDVPLSEASAVLHLGDGYAFLPAEDARKVLVQAWGNPPDSANGVLGLVVPKGQGLIDALWGAVVTYQQTGYVTDDDARTADYDTMLADLRKAEPDDNAARAKAGYPAMHVVGWAQPPLYDAATHALIWARTLRVDGQEVDGLNYDVRLLGRNGVLSLNMLSDMQHLGEVRTAARAFGRTAEYKSGFRYADFDPDVDKKAGYGLAGLVAAGVGVVAAKKLGLMALILVFGKKLAVLGAVIVAAAGRFLKRLRRRGNDGEGDEGAA